MSLNSLSMTSSSHRWPLARFLHISDLHFGDHFANEAGLLTQVACNIPGYSGLLSHSYQAARALSLRMNQIIGNLPKIGIPWCVLFTGDLTKAGKEGEFIVGNTFLRSSLCLGAGNYVGLNLRDDGIERGQAPGHPQLFAIPGNHDIWSRNDPKVLGTYRQSFPGNFPIYAAVTTSGPSVIIHGLDSTQNAPIGHKFARGRVAPEELETVEQRIRNVSQQAIQLVCIHHTLSDPPEKTYDLTMRLEDREVVCKRLYDAGADLVLSGHVHEWFASPLLRDKSPNQFTIGTGAQQQSKRSFAVLDIFENAIRAYVFEFDEMSKQFIPAEKPLDFNVNSRQESPAQFA
jgi:hypothetical protein